MSYPLVPGTRKAADFKFGNDIHAVYPKNSLLKILEKRERWRTQRLPKFLDTPIISETAKAIRTSNFVRTLIGWIGTKARAEFWEK